MGIFDFFSGAPKNPTASTLDEARERIGRNDRALKKISLKDQFIISQNVIELCQLLLAHPYITLETLDLSYNLELNDVCCDVLSKISVQKIDISGTKITRSGVQNLLQNNTLRNLVLRQNNSIKGLNDIYFHKNTHLVSLDVTSCDLQENDVLAILECKSLRSLILDQNPSSLTQKARQALAQSGITDLSLTFNRLADDATIELQTGRQTRLDLRHNYLSIEGMERFFEHPHLTKLILKPGNQKLSQEDADGINNSYIKKSVWCNLWKLPKPDSLRLDNYQMVNTK